MSVPKISQVTVFAVVAALLVSVLIYVVVAAATGPERAQEVGQAVVEQIEAQRAATGAIPRSLGELGYSPDGQAFEVGEHRVFYQPRADGSYLIRVVVDNASWVDYDSASQKWLTVE